MPRPARMRHDADCRGIRVEDRGIGGIETDIGDLFEELGYQQGITEFAVMARTRAVREREALETGARRRQALDARSDGVCRLGRVCLQGIVGLQPGRDLCVRRFKCAVRPSCRKLLHIYGSIPQAIYPP